VSGGAPPGLELAGPRGAVGGPVLLGRGFRPFFLLAGLHGALLVPAWLGILAGRLPAPDWPGLTRWHAHEMLFGFVAAAVAGFLLTSVPVWTGRAPVVGARLAALAALWLAGRIAMLLAGWLPGLLVSALDLAFLPALAAALAPALVGTKWKHGVFLLVLAGLAAANLAVHLDARGVAPGLAPAGLRVAVDLTALLVAILGGRITPAFTANALRRAGIAARVVVRPWLDRLAVGAVLAYAGADLLAPRSAATGALALAASVALAGRLVGWQGLRSAHDPLVGSLHAGYAWLALGFAGVGLGDLGGGFPWTTGVHALTAGAFGAMILAVMTRVGLGHTGRPLVAPRGAVLAYGLVSAGALLRTFGPLLAPPSFAFPVLVVSGLLWSAAFASFLAAYAPILLRPRVDGQPG
jgi:uncharacterized protein involved in response to NO